MIGRCEEGAGVELLRDGKPYELAGWDHFRQETVLRPAAYLVTVPRGLFLVRRLAWTAVMFLSVTVVTFVIFFVIPSEATGRVGARRLRASTSATTVQIHGPIYEEYAEFVRKIVTQGSLGNSWVLRGQEVNELIVRAAPVTLSLVIGGAMLWMLIAIPVGRALGLRPRSLMSRFSTVFVLIGISAHPLWMGLMLVVLLRLPG